MFSVNLKSKYLLKRASKRKKIILCVVLIICVIILQICLAPDYYFLNLDTALDITSCYTVFENDSLSTITKKFSPTKPLIFFHETSCKGDLNSRQACAVESAAIMHPNWQIIVFFLGGITKEKLNTGSMKVLQKYHNIKLFRLNLVEYAKETPLEHFVGGGVLNRTRWKISHTSDALRYLSLYKWGGIYLDLDVIVVRSFEKLAPNWAARESDETVAAGALAFSKDKVGRKLAKSAIRDFTMNYRSDIWGHNGPGVITRVLKKLCNTVKLVDMSAESCKGFEVFGPELFYPVNWTTAKVYFETKELQVKDPFMHHVSNKITEEYRVSNDSVYANLAKNYCPEVYKTYGENFGV